MREIFSAKIFWTIAIVIAIISFLVGINMGRNFKSEMEVLLLPKNSTTSANIDGILKNAQEIPKTLKFYNQLLSQDDGIEDASQELPDYSRKQYWDSKVKIERLEKSHILLIRVTDASQFQANLMADQAAHTLSDELSQYYNIRTELETRIIDGPLNGVSMSWQSFLKTAAWSLIVGIFLAFVFFLVNGLLSKISFPKKSHIKKDNPFAMDIPLEPDYPIEEKDFEPMVKKASAPANLPFDNQIDFEENLRKNQPDHIFNAVKEIAEKNTAREASPEEVKARLNRLLRGEM